MKRSMHCSMAHSKNTLVEQSGCEVRWQEQIHPRALLVRYQRHVFPHTVRMNYSRVDE